MTYEEWERVQSFSPISPEASAAEAAWNAALAEARKTVLQAMHAETTTQNLAVLIDTELGFLETDFGTTA